MSILSAIIRPIKLYFYPPIYSSVLNMMFRRMSSAIELTIVHIKADNLFREDHPYILIKLAKIAQKTNCFHSSM